jgi:NAD(P)H-dependent FMN reductase
MSETKRHLLFLDHSPSSNTRRLSDAAAAIITRDSDVSMIRKTPLEANADDALAADGILIASTENIGYMAGLTKDFFDRTYPSLLDTSAGKPVAVYFRAGLDGTGSKRAMESILTGLRWRLMQDILICHGKWQDSFIPDVENLALTLALRVEMGA